MKRSIVPYLTFSFVCFLAFSCSRQEENKQWIQQAGLLMEENPDSALMLLAPVDTALLGKGEYARYVITMVRAKVKTDEDISADSTALFRARDILMKQNDRENAAWACFYSGRIHQKKGMYEQAGQDYFQASGWAEKTGNHKLKGLIQYNLCRLNSREGSYEEALLYAQNATRFFKLIPGGYDDYMDGLNLTGNVFLYLHEYDSALFYYTSALDLATRHHDTDRQRSALQNIAVAYRDAGNLDRALQTCRQAISLTSPADSIPLAQLYLNLADIYMAIDRKDSAVLYVHKTYDFLHNARETKPAARMYGILSAIEEDNKNFEQALIYHQQYTAFLEADHKERVDKKVMEIGKRYNFSFMQNKLLHQKQNMYNIATFIVVTVVLGAVIIAYFINRKRLLAENKALHAEQEYRSLSHLYNQLHSQVQRMEEKRHGQEKMEAELTAQLEQLERQIQELATEKQEYIEREAQLSKELEQTVVEKQLTDAKKQEHLQAIDDTVKELEAQKKLLNRQVEKLMQEQEDYNQREKNLIDQLRQLFDMVKDLVTLKDLAGMENEAGNKQLVKEVKNMLEEIDLTGFVAYINSIQADFAIELKKRHPNLKEKEYNICCLMRFGFSTENIALILGQEISTIRQARHDIRSKIDLQRSDNLDHYIATIF